MESNYEVLNRLSQTDVRVASAMSALRNGLCDKETALVTCIASLVDNNERLFRMAQDAISQLPHPFDMSPHLSNKRAQADPLPAVDDGNNSNSAGG